MLIEAKINWAQRTSEPIVARPAEPKIRKELGDVMTAGQSLVAKGRAEGEAKGRAEGEAKGRAEGMVEGGNAKLYELVQNGLLSVSDAAKNMGVSEEDFTKKMQACEYDLPK